MRLLIVAMLACADWTVAATYEVGPGKPYATPSSVPWESLAAGDTVLIYWRATPYRDKWVICRQGTASNPITVRGVPGPNGEQPVIDGNGALTRTALNYWNEARGLIKIGGANTPPDTMPQYIVLENLELRGAHESYTFTSAGGATQRYARNAAAVYVEKGEHITIRNCVLRDSGNGLFIGSPAGQPSRDFLVEGNWILGNGNVGSAFEHNNYSAAIGITFQYNRFGPLRAGASGNNLKDRSAGLLIRYNWIEGGNRQLDLVDAEDSSLIVADPAYRTTAVYGNVLIEADADGNRQMIHYGGDSGNTAIYRGGNLFVYHNTFISYRSDRTTLLRLSTSSETATFLNNIVYATAGAGSVALLDASGVLHLSHNWMQPGVVPTFGTLNGVIHDDGTGISGASPGFVDFAAQDFRLAAGSAAINAAGPLPAALSAHPVLYHYVPHLSGEPRPLDATPDIGAYEFAAPASRCDLNADGAVNVVDIQRLINAAIGVLPALPAGDLNRDGVVNVLDVQLLVNVVLGLAACPA